MKQIGQLEPIKKCPRDQLVFSQYTLSFQLVLGLALILRQEVSQGWEIPAMYT